MILDTVLRMEASIEELRSMVVRWQWPNSKGCFLLMILGYWLEIECNMHWANKHDITGLNNDLKLSGYSPSAWRVHDPRPDRKCRAVLGASLLGRVTFKVVCLS